MSFVRKIFFVLLTYLVLGMLLMSCNPSQNHTPSTPNNPSNSDNNGSVNNGSVNGLVFTLNDDGASYTVKGVGKLEGVVEIPATHEGLPVTAIGREAFTGKSKITEVIIPDSVKTIGNEAFASCNKLLKVSLGNGVERIGYAAFQGCPSLTEITLPESITFIDKEAFYYCYALIQIKNLSSLELTCGSTDNGHVACYAENIYTDKEGESKLKKSDEYIFYVNEATDTYYLIKYIGDDDSIVTPDDISGKEYSLRSFFLAGSDTVSVELSSGVTSIDTYAFAVCNKLETVVIGDGVTHIAENAFAYCGSLKHVSIGKNVSVIESRAFFDCDKIETVYFNAENAVNMYDKDDDDDNFIFRNEYINNNTEARVAITIGADVKSIPEKWYCDNCVSSITFEKDSVCESIGAYAFANQSHLTTLTLPDSVTTIEMAAFYGCSGLKSITMNGVTNIGISAFGSCALESVSIKNITNIALNAFADCVALKTVDLGIKLNKIGTSAFSGCTVFVPVLPDSVEIISDYAFSGCASIESITLPNGLKEIGNGAFNDCTSLTTIELPDSVTSLGQSAFSGCTSLKTADLGSNVTAIHTGTFGGCTSLQSVSFSVSVKKISNDAFYGCNTLDIYYDGHSGDWILIEGYRYVFHRVHCSDTTIDKF